MKIKMEILTAIKNQKELTAYTTNQIADALLEFDITDIFCNIDHINNTYMVDLYHKHIQHDIPLTRKIIKILKEDMEDDDNVTMFKDIYLVLLCVDYECITSMLERERRYKA